MAILFMLIATALLVSVLPRNIPPYVLCMAGCGELPLRDRAETRRVELCRDQCNREERNRCLAAHQDNEREKRKCWKAARDRCIDRCGDDPRCIEFCRILNAPSNPFALKGVLESTRAPHMPTDSEMRGRPRASEMIFQTDKENGNER
ncbi:hypothetical protein CSKR_200272 [Clonorchis sinensis]|uniref:Uncharacterized protein n=1 Tax=Clonorchis sinensis TaxID=79923 RepID=A0A8T1LZ80_CLOSI|nr:hypothetical protein CSKR_200272 [Clonorchis sinensis]